MDKIFIASDHAGFEMKEKIKPYLKMIHPDIEDLGVHSSNGPTQIC